MTRVTRTTATQSLKQRKISSADGNENPDLLAAAAAVDEMKKSTAVLSGVKGDVIFGVYLIVWLSGLLFAVKKRGEGELWPPYMPLEETMVEMHSIRNSAEFTYRNYWIPALTTVLYFAVVFIGPRFMENRTRPKHLKVILLVWNTFLFSASTLGAYRVIPPSFFIICDKGIHAFLCEEGDTWGKENAMRFIHARCELFGAGCVWIYIFCMSKIPEALDTVFLVLGKKRVRFLHWYHHSSVLWFCWINWAHGAVSGTAYAAMNLTVHSVMYFWYSLAAADRVVANGLKPGKCLSLLLTLLQIVQMLVGAVITFYIASVPANECLNDFKANLFGVLLYTSYLYLFMRFFSKAYCQRRKLKKL